jgi:transmembrane sensor
MKTAARIFPERTVIDRIRNEGKVDNVLERMELEVRKRQRKKRVLVRNAAAGIAILAIFGWAIPEFKDTASHETPPGRRTRLTLADGSTVDLNASTLLKTDFRYGRRIVTLSQGEAFFDVERDPSRPFVVKTPDGSVRVTGTAFDVRVSRRTEVTVLEGSIGFLPPKGTGAPSVNLAAGQQYTSGAPNPRTLTSSELEAAAAWRDGRISLNGLTLGEAMDRVGEYFGVRIIVSASASGSHLGGTLPLTTLDDFLRAIRETHYLDITPSPDGSYVIGRK